VLDKPRRFAFDDSAMDPHRRFPDAMAALVRYDPAYDVVWDRIRLRWVCITWMTEGNKQSRTHPPRPIFYLEDDAGVRQEPGYESMIGKLYRTDWRRFASTVEAFLDDLERKEEALQQRADDEHDERYQQWHKDWMEYLENNPETLQLTGFASADHFIGVAGAMRESLRPLDLDTSNNEEAHDGTTDGGRHCLQPMPTAPDLRVPGEEIPFQTDGADELPRL